MPDPVYTLHRLVWRRHAGGWLNLPGSDPIRTYSDRATAEAAATELEWDIRGRVNPFRCGGPRLHYQTAFDAARLFDWCLDHGLDPPGVTPESATWADWWDAHREGFTAAQRAAVWEVLDRVRFFRVIESEPAVPMHLVALPHFESDPIPSYGPERYVGCTPYMLVRRTETADALCHELYLDRLAAHGEFGPPQAGISGWRVPEPDPFGADQVPMADFSDPMYYVEHRPLALVSGRPPTPGREVFVVLRRGWRIEEGGEPGSWRWSPTHAKSCGRPVIAFGTQGPADAHMAKLEAEARTYPSPYRFGSHLEWGATFNASEAWGVLYGLAPIVFTNQWSDYLAADRQWNDWWDAAAPDLTADQVETAWSLFENLRFYEVVAREFRE
jgi:hypothetical protein